jgi:hypothetical protein
MIDVGREVEAAKWSAGLKKAQNTQIRTNRATHAATARVNSLPARFL